MKVVLFCGGQGTRMRQSRTSRSPKPMAMVGDRPLLWHLMRWYAHHGHHDFVLCLGHGADEIKSFFLDYSETTSNDFVLTHGTSGPQVEMLNQDVPDWRITFLDTGQDASIGERLLTTRPYLDPDQTFLANYGDVLTDVDLDLLVQEHSSSGAVASLLAVRPTDSFHTVDVRDDGSVSGISTAAALDLWVNGGFFVLEPTIFDHLGPGRDLVGDALPDLARVDRLHAVRHDGFWAPADTVKEILHLEGLLRAGAAPWARWDERLFGGTERRRGERRTPPWTR